MECDCVVVHGRLHAPCDLHGKWASKLTAISALCYTNLDDYKRETWPTCFVVVPRMGDLVEGTSGKRLRVVGITHSMTRDGQPHMAVELHK